MSGWIWLVTAVSGGAVASAIGWLLSRRGNTQVHRINQ